MRGSIWEYNEFCRSIDAERCRSFRRHAEHYASMRYLVGFSRYLGDIIGAGYFAGLDRDWGAMHGPFAHTMFVENVLAAHHAALALERGMRRQCDAALRPVLGAVPKMYYAVMRPDEVWRMVSKDASDLFRKPKHKVALLGGVRSAHVSSRIKEAGAGALIKETRQEYSFGWLAERLYATPRRARLLRLSEELSRGAHSSASAARACDGADPAGERFRDIVDLLYSSLAAEIEAHADVIENERHLGEECAAFMRCMWESLMRAGGGDGRGRETALAIPDRPRRGRWPRFGQCGPPFRAPGIAPPRALAGAGGRAHCSEQFFRLHGGLYRWQHAQFCRSLEEARCQSVLRQNSRCQIIREAIGLGCRLRDAAAIRPGSGGRERAGAPEEFARGALSENILSLHHSALAAERGLYHQCNAAMRVALEAIPKIYYATLFPRRMSCIMEMDRDWYGTSGAARGTAVKSPPAQSLHDDGLETWLEDHGSERYSFRWFAEQLYDESNLSAMSDTYNAMSQSLHPSTARTHIPFSTERVGHAFSHIVRLLLSNIAAGMEAHADAVSEDCALRNECTAFVEVALGGLPDADVPRILVPDMPQAAERLRFWAP